MSDSSVFAKLLSAAAFLALCAYLLSHMSLLLEGNSLTLRSVSVRESIRFEGIALRSEQSVCSERELKSVRTSGERVAAGGIVAVSDGGELRSPVSALFFEDTDGYEYLQPPESISAETLENLLNAAPKKEENSVGRLVMGRSWYIAASADTADAPEGSCTLVIDGEELSARILSTAPAGDGKSALLMEIKRAEFLSLRRCRGEIILREMNGLEVPCSAVGMGEDGKYFVTICTAAGKERAEAEILYNKGGKCLIAPSEKLREGMRIARNPSVALRQLP